VIGLSLGNYENYYAQSPFKKGPKNLDKIEALGIYKILYTVSKNLIRR
jgi:hypothetical protein